TDDIRLGGQHRHTSLVARQELYQCLRADVVGEQARQARVWEGLQFQCNLERFALRFSSLFNMSLRRLLLEVSQTLVEDLPPRLQLRQYWLALLLQDLLVAQQRLDHGPEHRTLP